MEDESDGDRAQRIWGSGASAKLVELGPVYEALGSSLAAFGLRAALTRRDECRRFARAWLEERRRADKAAEFLLRETVKHA